MATSLLVGFLSTATGVLSARAQVQQIQQLNAQVQQLLGAGRYAAALAPVRAVLALEEKNFGHSDVRIADALVQLATLYRRQGDYGRAEPLYNRALALQEKAFGSVHPAIARTVAGLALLNFEQGHYPRAEGFYRRALAIREKVLGPDDPDVAFSLNGLASLYGTQGKYAQAEQLFQRALAIREKALGPEHPEVAGSLANLAEMDRTLGRYAEAEPLYQRALAILEKTKGVEHPVITVPLDNLAELYRLKGDYTEAERLYRRALAIREKALGPWHPDFASSLNNVAVTLIDQGRYDQAKPLLERALAIRKKGLGLDHPDVAESMTNLAEVAVAQSRYDQAEALYRRALAIVERALGPENADVAAVLVDLAELERWQGRYAQADSLYRRTLAIRTQALGPQHPLLSQALDGLALVAVAQAKPRQGLQWLAQSLDIQEHNLSLTLATGSEKQKRDYLTTLSKTADIALSLHLQAMPGDAAAARLALTTVLRRKGRVLDFLSDDLAVLRQHLDAGDRQNLDELAGLRAQLAAAIFEPPVDEPQPQYRSRTNALTLRAEKLEADLSRRSADFAVRSTPIAIEAVQRQVPAGAALVELVLYRPCNFKATRASNQFGPPRYAAYLVRAGAEPEWLDLGDAARLGTAIGAFRDAVRNRNLPVEQLKGVARALDHRLMQPIRKKLGQTRQILLSPDSQLHLIPFAALVDEQNRYLVEQYTFSYLGSGRDLLRLARLDAPRQPPLIVADPDFDAASGEEAPQLRSIDIRKLHFAPLPATREEGSAIGALWPKARLLTGPEATENALRQVQGPSILHVATHGFFLKRSDQLENPLLRSGLVLAGFNRRESGTDDGVLTALEVSSLDLRGTQLVVLSACDTGLGDVADGEGIYGLRRALTLAGAQSELVSLWKVGDVATKDLMVDYYRQLRSQVGRAEALRQAQLQMIARPELAHPFYWSAFIPSGDWRPVGSN